MAFPDRNAIERRGEVVRLEPRMMDLLVYLAERPNEVLSAEQIISDVWPHSFVTGGALMTSISGLRKALGDDARRPSYIATIPKRGYRLIATSSARMAALAVLPIRNESGDPEMSFLADGLTAELIDRLGTVPALRVISRSSVTYFGNSDRHIRDIAKKLRVRLVLSGSMTLERRRQLVVSLQLTDAIEGTLALNDTFSRPSERLLELEHDIVEAVAAATEDRLRSRPTAKTNRVHPDAVIEYLRGRYHIYRQAPDHFDKALAHFERAVEIDPEYPSAHVGIADVWGAYGYWGARDAREVRDQVLEAAGKAIEIDPDNPDALVIRATYRMFLSHDWEAAGTDLRRAVALNPNLCHTRLIHTLLLGTLRRPQALDEIDRALRIDPLNPAVILVRALILSSLGDYRAASSDAEELLAIDPLHPPGLQLRADLCWQTGNPDAIELELSVWHADEQVTAALTSAPNASEALIDAAEVLRTRAQSTYVSPYEIARLLCLGGRIEAALSCIDQALAVGDFMRVDFLQLSPAFTAVRQHPGYRGIAGKLGVPA